MMRSLHASCAGKFRTGSRVHCFDHFHSLVFRAPFPPCSHSICCVCLSHVLSLSLKPSILLGADGADVAALYSAPRSEIGVMRVENHPQKSLHELPRLLCITVLSDALETFAAALSVSISICAPYYIMRVHV